MQYPCMHALASIQADTLARPGRVLRLMRHYVVCAHALCPLIKGRPPPTFPLFFSPQLLSSEVALFLSLPPIKPPLHVSTVSLCVYSRPPFSNHNHSIYSWPPSFLASRNTAFTETNRQSHQARAGPFIFCEFQVQTSWLVTRRSNSCLKEQWSQLISVMGWW